jgi:tol-pal system protein YbgF
MGTDPSSMNCGIQQQSNSGYNPAPPLNSATTLPAPPPSAPPLAPSGAQTLAPGPGVLGTLSSSEAANASAPVLTAPPSASVDRSGYDKALNQMGRAQFDEARAGFRTFADTYPKDALAPQAIYWTGVISYTQKDYASAARAFAEGIKKYPTSARAPESMFKLGQTLIALGQKSEGCTTLGALPGKYPQTSKAILAQANAARKGARCP